MPNEDYECFECQDRGFILQKDGTYVRCACRLKKDLLNYLGEYKDFKILKSMKARIDNYKCNLILRKQEYNTFGNVVKTILALSYLDDASITYESITGNDLIDGYFITDEYGGKIYNVYYDTDILILKLGRDNINKAMPDLLANLLTYRKEKNKITIIYEYKEANDSRMKQYYGEVAIDIMKEYKEIRVKSSIV